MICICLICVCLCLWNAHIVLKLEMFIVSSSPSMTPTENGQFFDSPSTPRSTTVWNEANLPLPISDTGHPNISLISPIPRWVYFEIVSFFLCSRCNFLSSFVVGSWIFIYFFCLFLSLHIFLHIVNISHFFSLMLIFGIKQKSCWFPFTETFYMQQFSKNGCFKQ